jgi:hypothetical protein
MEHADAFSRQHSDDMQHTEGLQCVLLATTGLFELDPDISEISRWKISDNHQRGQIGNTSSGRNSVIDSMLSLVKSTAAFALRLSCVLVATHTLYQNCSVSLVASHDCRAACLRHRYNLTDLKLAARAIAIQFSSHPAFVCSKLARNLSCSTIFRTTWTDPALPQT